MLTNGMSKFRLIEPLLDTLQWLIAGCIPVLAMHRYRYIFWHAPTPPINTPIEFRGLVFFLVDYLILALIALGLLLWLINSTRARHFGDTVQKILSTQSGSVWIGLIVWMGIGVTSAYEPTLARYATLQAAVYLIMSFWVADLVRGKHHERVLLVFVTGATLHSILAIAQFVHGGALGLNWLGESAYLVSSRPFRANGLTDNPNSFGGYMTVALFACSALLYHVRTKKNLTKALVITALMLLSAGLLVTFSRGAIGATILAAILVAFAIFWQHRRLPIQKMAILLGVWLLIVGINALVFGPTLYERMLEFSSGNGQQPEGYFLNRNFYIIDTNAAIAQSGPLGVGANNLMTVIAHVGNDSVSIKYPVHNVYWLIRAEHGIWGTILFILACAITLKGIVPFTMSSRFIWSCCFLAICLIMLVEFYFWASPHSKALLFFSLGMAWGASSDHQ